MPTATSYNNSRGGAIPNFINSSNKRFSTASTLDNNTPPPITRLPAPSSTTMLNKGEEFADRLKIFIGTWNMYGRLLPIDLSTFLTSKDDDETATHTNIISGLNGSATHPYHLLVIGTQECERDISESLFYPSKEVWEKRLSDYLGSHYKLIKTETLAALHIAVFCWLPVQYLVRDVQSESIKTGWANMVGNKGAVAISILFGSRSLLFINCHLRAHQTKLSERNANVSRILTELKMPSFEVSLPNGKRRKKKKPSSSSHPPSVIDQFDHVFLFGDTNYRINAERPFVFDAIKQGDYNTLLEYDQLSVERRTEGSPLGVFQEHPIKFPPTYKLDTILFTHGHSNNLLTASNTNVIPHDSSEDSEYIISNLAAPADNIPITTTATNISLATTLSTNSTTSSLHRINSKQQQPVNNTSTIVIKKKSTMKNSIKRRLSSKRKLEQRNQVYLNGHNQISTSESINEKEGFAALCDSKIALFDSPTTILSYDSSEKQRVPSWTDRILWCDRASKHRITPPSLPSIKSKGSTTFSSTTTTKKTKKKVRSERLSLFPFGRSTQQQQQRLRRDTICYAYDAILHESLFGVSDHMPVIGVFGVWFDEWSCMPQSSTSIPIRLGRKKRIHKRIVTKLPLFMQKTTLAKDEEKIESEEIPPPMQQRQANNNIPLHVKKDEKIKHRHWWQRLFS